MSTEGPRRHTLADAYANAQETIRRLTERRPAAAPGSVIEVDYKKSPGDTGPRTSWHIEVPAGHDEAETQAAFVKAQALHDAMLAKYATENGGGK
jgi:hypothetical protein